ncbi:MAG: hypothetical protein HC853_03585 [Anaerolineae bacterium]|nr:hypothetical protein [Anaerolineae bacterium]
MLTVLLWYLWTQAFAIGGSWAAARWLRHLPDRGYGVGKALGLLLGGYFYWILVTLRLAQNNSGAVLMGLVVLLAIGYWLGRMRNQLPIANSQSGPSRRIAVVVTELIFVFGFVGCALYRAYNPDIISAGGEKYMESMMLNAILRSSHFPPNDAWLSGFAISYYYFGYVILAMLTKISGIASSVAFNLGGATIFALAMSSAFSVGFNLWALYEGQKAKELSRAWAAGLLTAFMLGLMGNMGGVMGVLRCGNVLPASAWQWLDVRDIANQPTECTGLRPSGHFYSWWWDWSRVVKDVSPDNSVQEVITETPAFSFVLGDNHPHTLALPFVLVALSVAIHFVIVPSKVPIRKSSLLLQLLVGVIVIGGLSFLNTWDFPVYGVIVLGGLVLGHKLRRESVLLGVLYGLAMLVLGYLLYLPFYATFSSQARGIGVNLFNGTRLVQFVLMFAPFLLILAGFITNAVSNNKVPMRITFGRTLGFAATVVGIALLAAVALGLLSPQNRALAAEMQSTGSVMGVSREMVNQRLLGRALSPGTVVFLSIAIASCATLFLAKLNPAPQPESQPTVQPGAHDIAIQPVSLIVLALFALGAALTLAPEFIFLQDLFGTRMNTVFKFYYQAWTLWSVAGASAVISLLNTPKLWARIIAGLTLLLVAAGMLYPLLASFSKTNNFSVQPTLDGAAYLQTYNPDDAKAIEWLNKNVMNDPVILERPDKGSYGYEGRISAFTGLPTPLGWGGHQNQWRGNYDEPGKREPMIASAYTTTDIEEARNLLNQLNVSYVVVGGSERAVYPADGLAKFANFCGLAFASGEGDNNTTIYKCR